MAWLWGLVRKAIHIFPVFPFHAFLPLFFLSEILQQKLLLPPHGATYSYSFFSLFPSLANENYHEIKVKLLSSSFITWTSHSQTPVNAAEENQSTILSRQENWQSMVYLSANNSVTSSVSQMLSAHYKAL